MLIGYLPKRYNRTNAVSHFLAILITLNCAHAPRPDKEAEILENRQTFFSSHYGEEDDDEMHYNPKPFQNAGNSHGNTPLSLEQMPAFSAVRVHPAYRLCPRGDCVVIFENILAVSGHSFDQKSGLFICPVPGLYFFIFSAISPSYSSFRLALVKNNQEIISAYGSAKGYAMASNSVILPLQVGDKICLKLLEGELYESDSSYRAYTSFSGFMVQNYGGTINHGPHHGGGHHKGPKFPDRGPFQGSGGGHSEAGPRTLPFENLNSSISELEIV